MRNAWLVALTVAVCAALPAAAQEPDAPKKKEKLICRYETQTGSRTRTNRTCLTESQWRELAVATRKDVDDFTRRSLDASSRSGSGE